ncbi:MAG: branched-chain amino acid ABC transporter permease [Candidatus Bathyarchaeia archaeon]
MQLRQLFTLVLVFFAFLAFLPKFLPSNWLYYVFLLLIYMSISQAWNFITGYNGLVFLGPAAAIGLAAHLMALALLYGMQWQVSILVAITGVGAFFCLMSFPLLRMRGIYFGIGTLLLVELLRVFFTAWDPVPELVGVGGGPGYPIRVYLTLEQIYWLGMIPAFVSIYLTLVIVNSKMGLAIAAMRDDEDEAERLGLNTFWLKVFSLVLSTMIMAFAGTLFYLYQGVVNPLGGFGISWLMTCLLATVIGGLRTIIGPILGSIVMVILTIVLPGLKELSLVVEGVILVVVISIFPRGLAQLFEKLKIILLKS